MRRVIYAVSVIFLASGCTTLVTAPISVAGTVVSTAFDIAGSAGGAIVNTVTGGDSDDDD